MTAPGDPVERRDRALAGGDGQGEHLRYHLDLSEFLASEAVYGSHWPERRHAGLDREHAKSDREASHEDLIALTEDPDEATGGQD